MKTFHSGKRIGVTAFFLLLSVSFTFAQKHFSLQQLISASLQYQPVLKQKQALLNSTKAIVTDVKHSFLPQIRAGEQVNIGSDNSLAGGYFTFGITPSASAGVRASNNAQAATGNLAVLYSEYELVNFGLNTAKLNNANAYVGLQQADVDREQYLLQLDIARLYFNLLRQQYRLGADKQNTDRAQQIFTVIQALTSSGINPGADSSLAKAELSKTIISYNQTLGRINQLKEQLSLVTGIAATDMIIDTLSGTAYTVVPSLPAVPADSLHNPLLDYFSRKKEIYASTDNLIRKLYGPRILLAASTWARGSSIQYNDNYKSLGTGIGYQRFNYMAGIAFTYNLFNGLYKKDKLAINRYQLEASGYELQQQQLSLQAAIRQADNTIDIIRGNLQQLTVQLQSAQVTYEQKTAQYKAGLISLIDLTNASFVLYRSQTDFIETTSEWYLALLDKAAASGQLVSFIQTIK